MTDPDDLYGASVLDHGKHPRNTVMPEPGTHSAERSNALCGDRVRLSLRVVGDRVLKLGHDTRGCLLCVASASMLTEVGRDLSVADLLSLASRFHELLGAPGEDPTRVDLLGPLAAFAPVARDAMRRQCVALAWDALRAALADYGAAGVGVAGGGATRGNSSSSGHGAAGAGPSAPPGAPTASSG